jgi:DNA-binding transcriptional MerR regulator
MSYGLKIGELAERCGVSRDALRFYERVGLLRPPRRTPSGHRLYDQDAVRRMEIIRRSQQIGLTLDDIRELLRVEELPEAEACERIAERLRARIEAIDQQLSTLQTFRRRLAETLALCESPQPDARSAVQLLLGLSEASSERKQG